MFDGSTVTVIQAFGTMPSNNYEKFSSRHTDLLFVAGFKRAFSKSYTNDEAVFVPSR